jgi:iron complex transport system permease protein
MIVFVNEWQYSYPYAIPLAAILGSLLTLLLVFILSQRMYDMQLHHLILTGIAISTLLIAVQGVIMYALRDRWQLLQILTEWEAGTTQDRSWQHVHMQLPLTLVGLAGCWKYRYEMDILTLGIEEAKNLGVDVQTVRWHLFFSVSLLVGGALAAVGVIAFFGLVLPHLLRSLFGPSNTRLIPLCILAGAGAFSMMDVVLRILDIQTFTIGNMSAILGGIFFVTLLLRSRHNRIPAS